MKSEFLKKVIFFAFFGPALFACTQSPDNGNIKVKIPVEDGQNNYFLQVRELHTVTDINAMAGTAAVFKADGHYDIDVDDSGKGFIEEGFEEGTTPSAHFLKIDGVYHATDFMSLSMAAAMYHFENIKSFYDEFGATENLVFPRTVLINIAVNTHKDDKTTESANNAAYVPVFDVFWVNPYVDVNIPLTFNGGVLAHEYLHSIFMKIIKMTAARHLKDGSIVSSDYQNALKLANAHDELNEWLAKPQAVAQQKELMLLAGGTYTPLVPPSPGQPNVQVDKQAGDDNKTANGFLFASVNEGIADFFGYEYSNNASWIMASLPSQKFRILSGSKQFLAAPDVQQRRFIESVKTTDPSLALDVHGIGAYYSHFLWTVANDATWGHEAAKKATLEFMKNYADFLVVSKDKKYLSMGDLVRLFFKNRAPGPDLCTAIQTQFPTELNLGMYDCGTSDPTVIKP